MSQFPKICPCCRTLITEADWERLPFKGFQPGDELEYRDHSCGSTLTVLVEAARGTQFSAEAAIDAAAMDERVRDAERELYRMHALQALAAWAEDPELEERFGTRVLLARLDARNAAVIASCLRSEEMRRARRC